MAARRSGIGTRLAQMAGVTMARMRRLLSHVTVDRLLCDKMFEGEMYQGEAEDTRAVLYLLAYYAEQVRDAWDGAGALAASFLALKKAWSQLVGAALLPGPLRQEDVAAWHAAQLAHQRLSSHTPSGWCAPSITTAYIYPSIP